MSEKVQEREINIIDMFWYICTKWRVVIIFALVFALVVGGMSYVKSSIDIKNRQTAAKDALATLEQGSQGQEPIAQEQTLPQVQIELTDEEQEQVDLYVSYAEIYNRQCEYNKESVWMNLNSNGFYEGNLTFYVDNFYVVEYPQFSKVNNIDAIIESYESILEEDKFREECIKRGFLSDHEIVYLEELVNCNLLRFEKSLGKESSAGREESIFTFKVYAGNEELCNSVIEMVEEYVKQKTSDVQQLLGDHEITLIQKTCSLATDSELLDYQRNNVTKENSYYWDRGNLYNNFDDNVKEYIDYNLYGQLLAEKEEEIVNEDIDVDLSVLNLKPEISLKFVVLGLLAGAFLAVFAYVIIYMFNSKLRLEDDFDSIYNVNLLGNVIFNKEHKKRWFVAVDRFIIRMRHINRRFFPENEAMEMLASTIRIISQKENVQKIYITGNAMYQKENAVALKLADVLKQDNIELIVGKPILYDAASAEMNAEIGNVILLETAGVSGYYEIGEEIQICKYQDINILGAIVVA